jgi:nicotinamide-nucleotide amidase
LIAAVTNQLGDRVFATDDDAPIEELVGRLLQAQELTLAVAESCTGGMLGARCTSVSGASGWFLGGVISYANDVKTGVLGVDPQALIDHGAVSEQVAMQMASGVQQRLGANVGIGITGVAGPGGGSADKPVGTVWIGVASGNHTSATKVQLVGDRETIRRRSSVTALHLVRKALAG